MPAQSKSQQRFFGVVKAMQKGDIPKKGRAGKIAKTMSKDDVDDFASTKHKGKPEKVKREQRVRNLIKKMVREELENLNEGKFKMKGKYLYMPDGEVSSIPKRNDRDRIIIQIKNEKFELYDNGFNEFNIMGSRNSYHPKGQKDLERFLNKNKAKYIGID